LLDCAVDFTSFNSFLPYVYDERTFPNAINRNPLEWKPFYSKPVMEQALARITTVSFNQSVELEGGVSVIACPSGYSIGSSNWVFKTEYERIGYLASSSIRSTHSRPVEWEKLQDCDALILTSLSRTPDFSSEGAIIEVAQTVVDTLKRGGNVLMPVNPVGFVYDLIDVVSRSIDNAVRVKTPRYSFLQYAHCERVLIQGGAILEARIYFISPVAKGALAYSNVNAEWLAETRQNAVYVPEEPFCHTAVLTGHPSLRIGDAPHLLEMWGNDSRNALIMTDPDFPLNEVYAPFEDLAIRAFYYPIETRLEFSQVNTVLLPVELKPKVNLLYIETIKII
uniref:Beta-Casp domain-containing protein n=1 Tax=Haemonchus placei TaxID=6290 RepID=A0A158QKT0_HAEPC